MTLQMEPRQCGSLQNTIKSAKLNRAPIEICESGRDLGADRLGDAAAVDLDRACAAETRGK